MDWIQLKTVVLSEYLLEGLDPTKNGGTVRIFIGGDWIQLKTVVLSEYLLEENGSN